MTEKLVRQIVCVTSFREQPPRDREVVARGGDQGRVFATEEERKETKSELLRCEKLLTHRGNIKWYKHTSCAPFTLHLHFSPLALPLSRAPVSRAILSFFSPPTPRRRPDVVDRSRSRPIVRSFASLHSAEHETRHFATHCHSATLTLFATE